MNFLVHAVFGDSTDEISSRWKELTYQPVNRR